MHLEERYPDSEMGLSVRIYKDGQKKEQKNQLLVNP
jgi:hypothetical protein